MIASWKPNKLQDALLKAGLLAGQEALSAWQDWSQAIDLDNVDPASFNLLPKLSRNMEQFKLTHPLIKRISGVYRSSWARNQLNLFNVIDLLKTLQSHGVKEMLLLKGAAMTLFYYDDYGVRPMGDIDILVPIEQVQLCISVLNQLGWRSNNIPEGAINQNYTSKRHAIGFRKKSAYPEHIDLHWHIFLEYAGKPQQNHFFVNKQKRVINNFTFYTIPNEYLFLQTCVHGIKTSSVPLIRWIMDTVTILQKTTKTFNWDLLIKTAKQDELVLPLRTALSYLAENYPNLIPKQVIEELNSIIIPARKRWFFYFYNTAKLPYTLKLILFFWLRYKRSSPESNFIPLLIKFPGYCKHYWGLKTLWHFPGVMIKKLIKACKNATYIKRGSVS